ncbi:P-loop NTPase fold protein [Granulicella sp. S190]|uniref:KAP family P-loop NTPase fold protein n=1 Tax=Granulicella sp. S190 TaxID=1747226 RepID=UPI00131AA27B|nr:P-loop NTPase fold protein [Granulicella sp. S190]
MITILHSIQNLTRFTTRRSPIRLLTLINNNDPPLSIGLFGSWGIGKSTIVNILFRRIDGRSDNTLKPIYFNAWKYSGDSFRRQFLLEVAKQIYDPGDDNITRLEQLNYTDVLKQTHDNTVAALTQVLRDALKVKFAFRSSAVARFLVGCLTLLLAEGLAAWAKNPIVSSLLLVTIGPAVFVWFSQLKFEDVFFFQEAPLHDPKLIFPEQFEREFGKLIDSKALNGKRAVIVIDDLDRCEPKVVQDILISTKNFIGQKNCFFIVPCDDKTIVQVFSEPNQKRGYQDESLRKYFNISLRIPPIRNTDLVDFANTTARENKIPEEVVQIAVIANCRDVRKMKHFLNSFAMKYQIAKARESAGLMPKIVDTTLPELAKAVLIEDSYPDLFASIVETPRIYSVLEKAALESSVDSVDEKDELKAMGLETWESDYPGLRQIFERTRDIKMLHADVFFSLKSTNTEIKIPRGSELGTALIEGQPALIDEIAAGIVDPTERVATADLVVDQLNRTTRRFLQRTIMGTLRLYCVAKVFSASDSKRVASAVTNALLHRDTMGVLTQETNQLLTCAQEAGQDQFTNIMKMYETAIKLLQLPSPPDYFVALVTAIYRFPEYRIQFADLFNDKFASWSGTKEGLNAIEQLRLDPDLDTRVTIPSQSLLQKILTGTVPGLFDVDNNTVRRSILFANWNPTTYTEPFVQTLNEYLKEIVPGAGFSPELTFVVESIELKHDLAAAAGAPQVWLALQPLYKSLSDEESKRRLCDVAIIFAAISLEPSVRISSKEFLLGVWRSLTDVAPLRKNLEFVMAIQSPRTSEVLKAAVEQELTSLKNEIPAPTEHTMQRISLCLDYSEYLPPDSIDEVFLDAISVNDDVALEKWLEYTDLYMERLNADFPNNFQHRCLELIRSNAARSYRQEILLNAFAKMLTKSSPDREREFVREYFELLRGSDVSTRDLAAAALQPLKESLSGPQELKNLLGSLLGDWRKELKTEDLLRYGPVFYAIVAQPELLGEYQWRDIAELSTRLLSHSDAALQKMGLTLAEAMLVVPSAEQEALLHALISIEASPTPLAERAKRRVDVLAAGELTGAARELLENRQQA